MCFAGSQRFLPHLQRREHREHPGDILGARATAFFLFAAEQQRVGPALSGALQKADPFWPAELMRASAHKIAVAQTHDRQLADPLRGVAEKGGLVLMAERQRFTPRLHDAGFVVNGHHGDQRGRSSFERFLQPIQFDRPRVSDRNKPMSFRKITAH